MQFLVIGRDGMDEQALARRMAARDHHLTLAQQMKDKGELLYAAALLDEDGRMTGSAMIVAFEDRSTLDAWLEIEPYLTGDVWRSVEVTPCAVPAFILA